MQYIHAFTFRGQSIFSLDRVVCASAASGAHHFSCCAPHSPAPMSDNGNNRPTEPRFDANPREDINVFYHNMAYKVNRQAINMAKLEVSAGGRDGPPSSLRRFTSIQLYDATTAIAGAEGPPGRMCAEGGR